MPGSCARRLLAVAAAACLLAPLPAQATLAPGVSAPSYLVVDDFDGQVLASFHPNEHRSIASITKIMTGYLVVQKNAPLSTQVTVPHEAAVIGESSLGLGTNERVTLGDLWGGLLVQSANDAADTMAVWAAGSQSAFVAEMNATAKKLGMDSTVYETPYGLDTPGQYSTARDQVRLARLVMHDATFRRFASMRSATILGHTYPSRNALLSSYPGLDGVKTGNTDQAGYCLIGSATRDGHRVFAAAFGTADDAARDEAVRRLLDFGFAQFHTATPVRAGQTIASVPVAGRSDPLPVRTTRSLSVAVRTHDRLSEKVVLPAAITTRVSVGQTVGRLDLLIGRHVVASSPLVAATATAPPSRGVVARIGHAFGSLF